MFRAGVILIIIIFLQVTTFAAACEWKDVSPSFLKALNAQFSAFQCETSQANEAEKMAKLKCANSATYFVFYGSDSIYMQTVSQVRNNVLTKCWRDGTINTSCEATVSSIKCQSYDLDTY